MSNISNFLASFKTEVSRPCNFDVVIAPPQSLIMAPYFINTLLTYRCEGAELPGRTFGLVEQKTYGPIEAFPVQNAYDKLNLTFICSDNMEEKLFFDKWMEVISQSSPASLLASLLPGVLGGRWNFDFEYKDNYSSDIRVIQKTVDNKISCIVKLIDAFPIAVNAMPLAWTDTNNYHRIIVTFAYRYFINENIPFAIF